jgi:hypothetical protein
MGRTLTQPSFVEPFTDETCHVPGADKSLARPGSTQATATKLKLLQATQKKKLRMLSVRPGLRGKNDIRVGRKMATFQLFFQSGRAKDLSAPLYKDNVRTAQ